MNENEQFGSGRQNQRHGEDAPGRVGSDQEDSKRAENEGSQGAIDGDSSWKAWISTYTAGGTTNRTRQEIIGKILRQLRSLQAAHLAYVQSHKERLETRLQENQKHQANIIKEMEELEAVIVKLLVFEKESDRENLEE